jgi:hypothetical protein
MAADRWCGSEALGEHFFGDEVLVVEMLRRAL